MAWVRIHGSNDWWTLTSAQIVSAADTLERRFLSGRLESTELVNQRTLLTLEWHQHNCPALQQHICAHQPFELMLHEGEGEIGHHLYDCTVDTFTVNVGDASADMVAHITVPRCLVNEAPLDPVPTVYARLPRRRRVEL